MVPLALLTIPFVIYIILAALLVKGMIAAYSVLSSGVFVCKLKSIVC
jgi:hypothetical protein